MILDLNIKCYYISRMHFCSNCKNMYYLKIQENEGNTLIYYCRNCGHEDTTLTSDNLCVSETQLRRSEQKYTHMVNEYTKFDPTLPRINTIKCPNQECSSNGKGGGATKKSKTAKVDGPEPTAEKEFIKEAVASAKVSIKKAKTVKEKKAVLEEVKEMKEEEAATTVALEENNNREVIYIRYDDINMKYVYLCVHCDTTWKTDNRN